MKKTLAWLLTLFMVLTISSVTVFAADTDVAKIGETGYATLEAAFAAANDGETITLLADAAPVLTSQRAITKAAVIDLNGNTLILTEDDLYFGTIAFKNGNIVVDPSVKPSTAVFWMFANQTLTFDGVKLTATGVTGTYLIGLDGNNSDLNLLNGSEIIIDNTTALDLDVICVNSSTGNDIVIEDSKVSVNNLDGRVFFRGNYTVSGASDIDLSGITKAGFRIEAGQTLTIEDTATVDIVGEPRDGGIHLLDSTAIFVKADTATVNATVTKPAPAGNNFTGYTRGDAIWGEVWGNATESFVIKVLDANDNVMGTTSLNNIGGILNGNVSVTWNIKLDAASNTDEYWTMSWTTAPSVDNMPAKVELWVDGVKVSGGNVVLNGPDDINKIYAATTDADGKILNYKKSFEDAITAGDNVAILRAGTYKVPSGKNVTITGAVAGVVFDNIGAHNMGGANVTFNNVTFNYAANSTYMGLQHSGHLVYNNCTFNGQVFLYGLSETFNNCEFNQNSADAYNVWTYGAKKVAFNGCTFNSAGKSVLVYTESATAFIDLAVANTTFNASAAVDGKAAIEIDTSLSAGAKITVDAATTATGFGTGSVSGNSLWNNKKGNDTEANNDVTVTVAGETVLKPVVLSLSGTGTAEDPFLIGNLEELIWFRDKVNGGDTFKGKVIKLMADIDLAGIEWTPIGTDADHAFKGVFDGDNKTISNLKLPASSNSGLFGYVGVWNSEIAPCATVKNLIIDGVTTNNTESSNNDIGGAVGTAFAAIVDNVHVKNAVLKGNTEVGGVVGNYLGTVQNCSFQGEIYIGYGRSGGVVGKGYGTVKDCQSDVYIEGSGWGVGAIIGFANSGTVTGNYATGTMKETVEFGDGYHMGGIVGVMNENAAQTITNNYCDVEFIGTGFGPVLGLYNTSDNATTIENLSTNSWNREKYDVDSLEINGTSAPATIERNNNLVMLESDLAYVDADNVADVTIMSFSNVTVDEVTQVVNAVASIVNASGIAHYVTLGAALAEAQPGDTVTLLADVTTASTITIDKAITLDGNGKTITYTGSDRAIEMANSLGAAEITIKNLTVNCSASYCQRGINYNATGKLTLDNVTVKGTNVTYAVNVPGMADGALITITNCDLSGNIALNVWGKNCTIDVTNTKCTAVDNNSAEGYASVKLNNDGSTSAEGSVINITGGKVDVTGTAPDDSEAISNGTVTGEINVSDTTVVNGKVTTLVAVIRYANDTSYSFETLKDAIEFAKDGETVVLVRNTTESSIIAIDKAITVDLNGKTYTSTAKKAFEVYANATIKNGTIVGANRCVDTRTAVELTLTNVNMIATATTFGNPQPLTIGGADNGTKVAMTNVNINAGGGYGIITFVKTDLTATGCAIGGYNGLYVKPGSENSIFTFVDCDLSGSTVSNDVEGNSFSTIAVRADNVTVNVDKDSTVTAAGNYCSAISLGGTYEGEETVTGASVTVAGVINGDVLSAYDYANNDVILSAAYGNVLTADGLAFANSGDNLIRITGPAVVAIGGKGYASFADAFAGAQNGDTIVLIDDVNAAVVYDVNKTLTLDLNGHTIESDATATLKATAGKLTIVDNSADKSGAIIGAKAIHSSAYVAIQSGKFVGTITTANNQADDSQVSISGGNFSVEPNANIIKHTYVAVLAEDGTYNVVLDEYEVIINGNGATVSGEGFYNYGEIVYINAVANGNYVFAGWLSDDVAIQNAGNANAYFVMPDHAVTVTAYWANSGVSTPVAPVVTGTLHFETNGGTAIDSLTGVSGRKVDLAQYVPALEGYTFAGWYSDAALTKPVTEITLRGTKTVYAGWIKNVTPDVPVVTMPFTDVAADAYYYNAVLWAVNTGITNGITDTTFAPDMVCTRAQVVTFLWRAAGCPVATYNDMPFADVSRDMYYYDAVLWAVEMGITNGISDTEFAPDAECSRAQIVTFLWRALGAPDAAADAGFVDVDADAYYATAVEWAVDNGITNGMGDNTFGADADCTRGQTVTFLFRFFCK